MQKYVNLVDLVKSFPTIATVICPNFHFSVSPHVPFLNLLFEQIAYSNEYLLAKIGVDTAENEPLEVYICKPKFVTCITCNITCNYM